MSSNIRLTKACQHCQQEFIAKTVHTRYCSHTCNRKAYKQEQREQKIKSTAQEATPPPDKPQEAGHQWRQMEDKPLLTLNEAAQVLILRQ